MTAPAPKNALLYAIAAALAVAIAIGAYFMFKGDAAEQPLPDAALSYGEVTGETPAATGADEQAVESAEPSEPVEIDIAAVTSTRAIGNPDAPIKVIEYASMTCSHCGTFHNNILPALKEKYIDTGKVYFEFREFPLNDPALKATLTARCLPESQYYDFVSVLFKGQGQWDAGLDYMKALRQNAKLAGMSDATFDACHAEPMLKLKIAENMQEAKDKWKISSTPTFVINDGAEIIAGARPLEEFERIFRKLSEGQVGEAPPVE
jgi:protein-disulfide isomerase